MENFKPLNLEQVENEADETFNNDLEIISLETEAGSMEIKKGDTFKWKSPDAVPFRIARIERINKNKVNFLLSPRILMVAGLQIMIMIKKG